MTPPEIPNKDSETPPVVIDVTAEPMASRMAGAPPPAPRSTLHLSGCAAVALSGAAVLIVAIAALAFLLWDKLPSGRLAQTQVVDIAGQTLEGVENTVRDVLQPKVSIQTQVISTGVSLLAKEGKLVVLTRTLPITVEKRSDKRVFWDYLSLGETVARVTVRENKVQHVVYLGELLAEDLQYDAETNRLMVRIPTPEVDPTMLVVASNPEHWSIQTEVGWARLEDWSGAALTQAAKAELDAVLLATAQMDTAAEEVAKTQARAQIGALLQASLAPLAPNIEVDVTFQERLG